MKGFTYYNSRIKKAVNIRELKDVTSEIYSQIQKENGTDSNQLLDKVIAASIKREHQLKS